MLGTPFPGKPAGCHLWIYKACCDRPRESHSAAEPAPESPPTAKPAPEPAACPGRGLRLAGLTAAGVDPADAPSRSSKCRRSRAPARYLRRLPFDADRSVIPGGGLSSQLRSGKFGTRCALHELPAAPRHATLPGRIPGRLPSRGRNRLEPLLPRRYVGQVIISPACQDVKVGSAGCGLATLPFGCSQSSCRPSAVKSSSAYAPMAWSEPRAYVE